VFLAAGGLEAGAAETAAALPFFAGGVLSLSIAAKDGFPNVLNTIYRKTKVMSRDESRPHLRGQC